MRIKGFIIICVIVSSFAGRAVLNIAFANEIIPPTASCASSVSSTLPESIADLLKLYRGLGPEGIFTDVDHFSEIGSRNIENLKRLQKLMDQYFRNWAEELRGILTGHPASNERWESQLARYAQEEARYRAAYKVYESKTSQIASILEEEARCLARAGACSTSVSGTAPATSLTEAEKAAARSLSTGQRILGATFKVGRIVFRVVGFVTKVIGPPSAILMAHDIAQIERSSIYDLSHEQDLLSAVKFAKPMLDNSINKIRPLWSRYLNALANETWGCASRDPDQLSAKELLMLMHSWRQTIFNQLNEYLSVRSALIDLYAKYNVDIATLKGVAADARAFDENAMVYHIRTKVRAISEDVWGAIFQENYGLLAKYTNVPIPSACRCRESSGGGSGSGACAVTCPPEEPFRGYEYRCCRTETGSSNTSCEGLLPNEWVDVDRTPEHRLYGQCSGGGGDTGGGAGGGTVAPTPTARPSWYTLRYVERLNALRAAMSRLPQSQLRSAVEVFLRANVSFSASVQDALQQTMRLADWVRVLVSEGNKHLSDIRAAYAAFAALKGERAVRAIRNAVTLKDIAAFRSWLINEREFIQSVNMLIAVPISGEGPELESIDQLIRVMIAQISESSELKIDIVLRIETALWKLFDLMVLVESSLTEVDKKRFGEIAGEIVSSYQRLAATAPEATLGYGDPVALAKNLEELGNFRALLEAREAELKEVAKGADAI